MTQGFGPPGRRRLLALGAVMIAAGAAAAWPAFAQSNPPATAAKPAPSAKPAKPAAETIGPEALVRSLYRHYLETSPETYVAFDYTNPEIAKSYFDPALTKLLVADGKREQSRLDFDPFVNGQEFEIKAVDYETRNTSAKEAMVTARFTNFDQDTLVIYKLVRTPAGWRIADVLWAGGGNSLKKLLSAPGA
ncbi:MAG: hypothetical protein AB1592_04495 [Pseudomonadota bacterium]